MRENRDTKSRRKIRERFDDLNLVILDFVVSNLSGKMILALY